MYPTNEREALEALKGDDAELAATAEAILWRGWCRSGDPETDRLFRAGVDAMQQNRLADAEKLFGELVKKAPDFAEAWNKRATVYYLAGEFDKSIADCHEVLKRNPGHFGALSGMGQIYFQLENNEAALAWYRKALEVNPNMLGVEMQIRLLEERERDRPAPGRST